MGIDYYSCKKCGEGFPDCGDYVYCECGETWCDDECAKEDGFIDESCKLDYELYSGACDEEDCNAEECEHFIDKSCKYCREEDFDDSVLLDFVLNIFNKDRKEIINLYKERKQYEKYSNNTTTV